MSTDFGFGFGGGAATEETKQGDGALVLDLSNVQDAKFEVIPQGTYDVIVEQCNFGNSSSGNPMITVVWQIAGGEYDKRKVWDFYTLNKAFGISRLKTFLTRVCPELPLAGFTPADFANQGVAIGRRARLKLIIKAGNDGPRNNVKEVLEPGSMDGFGFGG